MAPLSGPTVRRRRLAGELRRLRERAGLTGEQVAGELGWSASKVSRIELNRIDIKASDLDKLLAIYRVSDTHRTDLLALAREPRGKGWWGQYLDVLPDSYAAYIGLEAEADSALCWATHVVFGLLQTEDYTRAVFESQLEWMPTNPQGRIKRLVEVRMARQQVLTRERGLDLAVILDESVLWRRFGDPAVMRGQLRYLIGLSELPNVRLQILPLSGVHRVPSGSFTLLRFPPVPGIGPSSDVVYIEQISETAMWVEDEQETLEFDLAFRQLTADAADAERSRELIAQVAAAAWS